MIHLRKADAWPEPVEGHKLLNDIRTLLKRYMHMPAGAADALALWSLHTYCVEAADVTPYIELDPDGWTGIGT